MEICKEKQDHGDRMLDLSFHGKNLTHTPLSLWPREKKINTEIKTLLFIFIQLALLSLKFTPFYTDFNIELIRLTQLISV